jgi:hypothetical protein
MSEATGVEPASATRLRLKRLPDRVEHYGIGWRKTTASGTRSHVYKYCTVYQPEPATVLGGTVGKVKKLTEEHRLYLNPFDEHALIAKPDDASSNLMRHFKTLVASSSMSMDMQINVYRALLDVSENAKGGAKPQQQLKFDGESIKKVSGFKSVTKDAHPLVLRAALLGAAKHVPYAVLEDPFLLDVLRGLDPSTPKIVTETIQTGQIELYAHLKEQHTEELKTIKTQFLGLPWAHLTTDMWTARYSGDAYSSLALRCVEPSNGLLKTFKLGVVKFVGQHTAAAIKDHLETRLAEFNLSYDKDVASVATDSGANVRRCCLDLTEEKKIDWVPCILHGLHNASKYALGLVDEDIGDDHEVVRDIGTVEELFGNDGQ